MRALRSVACAVAFVSLTAQAGEVARGELAIIGLGLEVDRRIVRAATGVPSFVQTMFGGATNEQAPIAPGLVTQGELIGPGIDAPVTLSAVPGQKFSIPALHTKGEYALRNIRLIGPSGEFLQHAVPDTAQIVVDDALSTKVRVRQLTAAELRERGITIDARNYDVYEYTFIFTVDGSEVEIPYPVIIDKINRAIAPLGPQMQMPPPLPRNGPRPRIAPSQPTLFELGPGPDLAPPPEREAEKAIAPPRLPAALVVPTGFGVLHQFFAVILDVSNASEEGSNVRLDSISASLHAPNQLRVAKVTPPVSIGQPVPITDETTGATFLVAGARGSAEWTLEALKTGTHTVNLEIRAIYQKPGQDDFPMFGRTQASIVVSDPRFQVNFSHPDTVRKNEPYTAYAFVTNMSEQPQHVLLDTRDIPPCTSGGAVENICRDDAATPPFIELDLQPGQMTPVPYRLSSKITGRVFAAAGSANDETVGVSVRLSMGVSASGIPLSPATLLMPHYAQWVPSPIVDTNLQLLGLGYSLANAPLNKFTAAQPRVIRTDVFTRAQQIARAGQRIFTANDPDALIHLSLDLLDNVERVDHLSRTPPLEEWDQLRRQETSGRQAAAAMARELERAHPGTPAQFVDAFAAATSHRSPFLFAYVTGDASLSVSRGAATLDGPAETLNGWTRTLPAGELTNLTMNGIPGQLALVGRYADGLRVTVRPSTTSFTLHLLHPDTASGAMRRSTIDVTNATPGVPMTFDPSAMTGSQPVPQTPLRAIGAAQDLYLDAAGHLVTLLFNRPVTIAGGTRWRDRLALTINVPKASYSATRRNDPLDPNAELQIPGAVLQEDGRLLAITFDKTLSRNAQYELAVDDVLDLITREALATEVIPRIDNDRPGAILTGRVLLPDNTPAPRTLVSLSMPDVKVLDAPGGFEGLDQVDITNADGRFLFEYVPRDADRGLFGQYDLRARLANGRATELSGAVRRPGEVHNVNLVFAGRGRVQGHVRYDDGEPIANRLVSASSPVHAGEFTDTTDANGFFEMEVGVGPLTFFVVDRDGRTTFATNQLRTAGEVIAQDLVVLRQKAGGFGTLRVVVRRAGTNEFLPGAAVSIGVDGYIGQGQRTDANGAVTFAGVPAGVITILADHAGAGSAIEVDLRADQTVEQIIVLDIRETAIQFATLSGVVSRDDPQSPNDTSKDVAVANAQVTIRRIGTVLSNADGSFTIPDLPLSFSGAQITVFDPATGRKGWFRVPTLVANSTNHVPLRLSTTTTAFATMRVRLYGAQGQPVSGFEVLTPGYPPQKFGEKSAGIYEVANVRVPRSEAVVAIAPNANNAYGDQYAAGHVRVDFDGQIGVTDLRLPGAGTVNVRIEVEQSCSTPPCYAQALGPAAITYRYWDIFQQNESTKSVTAEPDPVTGIVTFTKVPARQWITVETVRHPLGHASQQVYLGYDGDARNVALRLKDIGDVTGRVFAHDGITPVSGAAVRIVTGNSVYSSQLSKPDGAFRFPAIAANLAFEIIADVSQDGIYRTGIAYGRTPEGGGPVSNLRVVLREQSSIEGRVVDALGAAVPLARYWLRELAWPHRSIGSAADPLQADLAGRFILTNIFTGPFRITAVASDNQELRGDYQGTLAHEGDVSQRDVELRIGQEGTGTVSVTVLDPLLGFEPVANAEVALMRGGSAFDFTSTNENGVAFFESVPAGTYHAAGYSKARVRGGASNSFSVTAGQTTPISVQLEFRGSVSGFVTDPDSEPVGGARVPALPVTISGHNYQMRDSTDANGEFELIGTPEGPFQIQGYEIGTERVAFGPPNLFISRLVPERRDVHLQVERFAKLTVKVHLPNDAGGPGALVPVAEVEACQCAPAYGDFQYLRAFQGNPIVFDRMIHRRVYKLTVRELGGDGRTITVGGFFPAGVFQHEHVVVLPATGTAEVMVLDGSGNPVADAYVRFFSNNRFYDLYTPPSGLVTIPEVAFGFISAYASKGSVSAAGNADVQSRSQPTRITLNLGNNIAVTGGVDAETPHGMPSVATRVVLNVSSAVGLLRLETRTDSAGNFTFTGVPVRGTTLRFIYYGEADTFIGAQQTVGVADGTTSTVTVPRVRLDATPPRILSFDPPANSTNVSPTAHPRVTFSEQIAARDIDPRFFQLLASDDGSRVTVSLQGSVRPDGTFIITVIPAARLRSNVLYRLVVDRGMHDLSEHTVQLPAGTSFTTVNYTEPAIVRIEPSENEALIDGQVFRVKFNKPIDLASFDAGNGGVVTLDRLGSHHGSPVATVPITRSLDPVDPSTLVIAPSGVAIAESSFYRLTIAGVRDTSAPPNVQIGTRMVDYVSFDRVKPVARIVSPVAAGEKLVAGVLYAATAIVTNDGTTDEASDVAYVDWLDEGGVSIARVKTKPFTYSFVAPSGVSSFTLKAGASDLSFNTGAIASMTWEVAPNEAPRDVIVTNTPAAEYPSRRVQTRVKFRDEGLVVTVALELHGTQIASQQITRVSSAEPFSDAVFFWNIPLATAEGTATVVARVTDSVNKTTIANAPLTVLTDTTQPRVLAFAPKAESRYQFGVNGAFDIEVVARDDESSVARATFTVNGVEVFNGTGTFDANTGVTTFRQRVTVPPKNADTRVPIVVRVFDHRGNVVTENRDVIYERVDDATLPVAAWLSPLDGAALPSNLSGWLTTLRVRATDDVKITSVRFESAALAAPIALTAPKSGTSDIFETKAALTMQDGTPFVIRAIISDGNPDHDVELPITIDPVAVAPVINADINISSLTADQYVDKSILVRGATVFATVPLTVKDLILIDGAVLGNPEETRLDLTITDRLFVDADSRIDLTGKGFLGGLRTAADNSFTNTSRSGRTVDGVTGATDADASHGGIGGSSYGATNATYGSIAEPFDFGSGGGAQPAGVSKGANGGGAVRLRGGRFVVAGAIRADAGPRGSTFEWGASAGGSIQLQSLALIASLATRITANGGDQLESSEVDRGGGGGRIAIAASERLELDALAPVLQARGGRNGNAEGAQFVDGGAGTIVVNGALFVSSFDERHPSTTHRTAGTPITGTFEAVAIGPRALARFDAPHTGTLTVDPSALVLTAPDVPTINVISTSATRVPRGGSVTTRWTASSPAGVREVRTLLDVQPVDVKTYPRFATTTPETQTTIAVPPNAPLGNATLKLRAVDRAGRVVESAPIAIEVVENTPPVITTFDVTPAVEMHAGHTIHVSAAASDDVAVTSLVLTSSIGTVQGFDVIVPPSTPANTDVALTLSASDGFPARPPTTRTHTVRILADKGAPSLAVVQPLAGVHLQEGSGATFVVEVTAADGEVAVQRVAATLDGVERPLTFIGGTTYRAALPVPAADGTEAVAKTLTISARDYAGNISTSDVALFVDPLVDPHAPRLHWVCGSPGAMAPPGYELALRVVASPSSPANGVSAVEIRVDGVPLAVTGIGSERYEARFTIPIGAVDGDTFALDVIARSVSGNEATLSSTVTAVTGIDIATSSFIAADDPAFEDRSVIVRAFGTLTIAGAHTLRNIVVLENGRLIQQHADLTRGDLVTASRIYIACNASVDVTGMGFAKLESARGAGIADDLSGGSHIGHGGRWTRSSGATFGSVLRPAQAGAGGHVRAAGPARDGAGGGIVRLHATTSAAIDGFVRANGNTVTTAGATGAGGSVSITTAGHLAGSGTIEARGGDDTSAVYSNGGGGAIAIAYDSASGTLLSNLFARGGFNRGMRHGAPGSVVIQRDLFIDNDSLDTSRAVTGLPSFGRAVATSADAATITIDRAWLDPSLNGHALRVLAPDGTTRGTVTIDSITNDATPVSGFAEVRTQDAVAYDGWIVHSSQGIGGRTFVAARRANDRWEYDDDSTFTAFNPRSDDAAIAAFSKDATSIANVSTFRCPCAPIHGLAVRELAAGEIAANAAAGTQFWGDLTDLGVPDPAELFLRPDSRGRALLLSRGVNTSVTVSDEIAIQPGDALQGVYRFENVTLEQARVVTDDVIESLNAPRIDATSSLDSAGTTIPTIDASRITVDRGVHGPVLAGAPGTVSDPESPVDLDTHTATPVTLLWNDNWLMFPGTRGGLSLGARIGSAPGPYRIATFDAIATRGHVAFTPSQNDQELRAGLGAYMFRLLANGRYEAAGRTGDYTSTTVFRIEKTPHAIRFLVDGVRIHEIPGSTPPLRFEVNVPSSQTAEIHSIDFDTNDDARRFRIAANADGSFRFPLRAAAGQSIAIRARDRHRLPLESQPVVIEIPHDLAVASLSLPAELIGGRTTTGTVTLAAPAGPQGALVDISGDDASIIPTSVVVASGATSATFTLATLGVLTAKDVTVTAEHGGSKASTVLRVVKDAIAPDITITAPAPNAHYIEGQAAKIAVRATITDADSGVLRADATIATTTVAMTRAGNVFSADLAVPLVDGSANVTLPVVVRAEDNSGNGAASSVDVIVEALDEGEPPIIAWSCGSDGAIYPANSTARLRVIASGPDAANPVETVSFAITDPQGATTTHAATLVNGAYEFAFATPDLDGVFTVRATATTISGSGAFVDASLRVLKGASEITSNRTITAFDSTFDGLSVIVREGVTLTIEGTHAFDRLAVFGTIAPMAAKPVDVTATSLYVACGASIDATRLGYGTSTTHTGARNVTLVQQAGSHVGRGGGTALDSATYGSIERPREPGAGDIRNHPGGGVVRLSATSLAVDGAVRANGGGHGGGEGSGAGGSIWITTAKLAGGGTIEADGGNGCWAGGGGAVAVHHSDATSTLPLLRARPGTSQCGFSGGPGTVFVRGPQSTFGNAIVDTNGRGAGIIELPSLGSGTARIGSSGATLVTDRTDNVWPYFAGHWVRIAGKGTWRIATISAKTVTLAPNANETISIAPGDAWQGVYRFDALTLRDAEVRSSDPIEATDETIAGTVTTSTVRADALDVIAGAVLTHLPGASLDISVSGDLRIAAGGAIDVTRRGYPVNVTYPGARNVTLVQQAASHIGRGGSVTLSGATYGSVMHPREAGAGDIRNQPGGGVVRIDAGGLAVNGSIRANGGNGGGEGSGAGGSIWITTSRIAGTGTIEADGGSACWAGGGGAISLTYTEAASAPPSLFARTGTTHCGHYGGAGSIYVFAPGANAGSVSFDNSTRALGITELPSFGLGIAQAGTSGATLVTSSNVPAYLLGREIEIDGKGTWPIASIDGATVTLAGQNIALAPGDRFRGVQRFNVLRLRNTTLTSVDRIVYSSLDKDAASSLTMNDSAPRFTSAEVRSALDGASVRGTVVDPDAPIRITVTNTRTAQTFTANAAANGSFDIPVTGAAGDAFTISAIDSHVMPLSSAAIDVSGRIEDANDIETVFVYRPIQVGVEAIGEVRILTAAGAGGVTIHLSSSDTTVATVPESVLIPAGQAYAQFAVTPLAVGTATITATFRTSRTFDLEVQRLATQISDLILQPPTAIGFADVLASIQLDAPAGPGGAVVTIATSDSYAAPVPAEVTVFEGTDTAFFRISTRAVPFATTAIISAMFGGVTKSAELLIEPCAPMDVAAAVSSMPDRMWFDDAPPAGATVTGAATFDTTQAASGTHSLHFTGDFATRSWSFHGAAPLTIGPDDELVLDVLVDSCLPPRQIVATWSGDTTFGATWGEAVIENTPATWFEGEPTTEWTTLSVTAKTLGITAPVTLNALRLDVASGEAWFDLAGARVCSLPRVAPSPLHFESDLPWFDDDAPAGATVASVDDGVNVPWTWSTEQAETGTRSIVLPPRAGTHQTQFTGATARMEVEPGDWIYAFVLLDPCNPPRQILLQFHDEAGAVYRVFWGEDLIQTGSDVPAWNAAWWPSGRQWSRLDVSARDLGIQESTTLDGITISIYDGAAWFDSVGRLRQ
jgi:Bacterial Ig-like domain